MSLTRGSHPRRADAAVRRRCGGRRAEDIRLFGGAIRRGTPEWDEGYKERYGVERLYAWWKVGGVLEGHYFRGKANLELHTI